MLDQFHRVRVFVFRRAGAAFEYLVVRHAPVIESFWTPVTGLMRPEESIFQAAVRNVGELIGLNAPRQMVDLELATHIQVGHLEEVDWSVGYHAGETRSDLRPASDLADVRWLDFDNSYRNLDLEEDRRSIMRLHFTLRSAG
ncbi:MAG: NUDIX hydrolase [Planctomycetes bacterium]|nr:NUDIX hydrolase [Planctomycetota bacterium]